MNKILTTSICVAALTTAASAFTLDLNSISGASIGPDQTINQNGTTFTVRIGIGAPVAGQVTSGGFLTTNDNSTIIIDYDNSVVNYTGTDSVLGSSITDTGSALVFTTGTVQGVNFASNVPEPSSTALLGLGGLALILRRRK